MRIPVSTYRLQFCPGFGFNRARDQVKYLSELGISDIYASPIFKAKKGSQHGYDVVDPNQLNPELGSDEEFEGLFRTVQGEGMGWIQDIVPNHMAFDGENALLADVLENGECSEYFDFFDIEWSHYYESINGKVLAPFLGRLYGESLEDAEISIQYDRDGFSANYYELKFPLRAESYAGILTYGLGALRKKVGEDHPDFIKLLGILYALKNLPASREESAERHDQIRFIKRILWELYAKNPDLRGFIDANIHVFNGRKGDGESFNRLDALLAEQLFRLSFWKVATEEIDYRRFFNINGLISLRIEDDEVFAKTHSLILRLVEEGKFTGLRVDHIDGLLDPTRYLKRLRERAPEASIVVEKILDRREDLPAIWPIEGTTGYDFMNCVNGVFCRTRNSRVFSRIYAEFSGLKAPYEDLVSDKKRLIIGKEMAGDIDNLAHLMKRVSGRYRHGSDLTLYGIKRALVDVMAFFPVYRTYMTREVCRKTDRAYVQEAVKEAKHRNPGLLYELNFIEKFLLLEFDEFLTEGEKDAWLAFVMRFQQFTGPLMAKGFEDTVFYIYNRLLSLNEVGGSPDRFGATVREFHSFNRKRAKLWPRSLNATSTHDTKRGEDVRARIDVLSEIPREWKDRIRKWTALNKKKKSVLGGKRVPDKNDEYFLYQTLVGTFPFEDAEYDRWVARIKEYMIKAVREAKVHTAWLKPDTEYEEAFLSFVEEILKRSEGNEFLAEFLPFQKRVAGYGIYNSLAQTLLKITAPGIPDFYQGTELWDLHLVDPDNRCAVDFEKRAAALGEIRAGEKRDLPGLVAGLLSSKDDGRVKLFLIYRALKARAQMKQLFQEGEHLPLGTGGRYKDHIVAFARRLDRGEPRPKHASWAVTVVPRFLTAVVEEGALPLGREAWEDTHLDLPERAPSHWREALTGAQVVPPERHLPVGDILTQFPVALLVGDDS